MGKQEISGTIRDQVPASSHPKVRWEMDVLREEFVPEMVC